MIKTYEQAKAYLESFIPQPNTLHRTMQLDRIEWFCKLLGDPQKKYPIIHVGGTSGKGSTATFAATILKELGLKTALHISPHLKLLTERMQIDNHAISIPRFLSLLNELTPIIQKMTDETRNGPPTYFEILVVMSFLYFSREKVDAAIIEVGLGGTLDGTNIIPPSVAVLTNVSLDHTQILGNTVYKICKDKMGILKKGAPAVISGLTQPQLRHMLIRKCQELDVPLYLAMRDFQIDSSNLSLPGEFQHLNFTLAKKAAAVFTHTYFPKLASMLSTALKRAKKLAFIPGRLEIVNKNPLIILDGAHNRAKMKALVDALKKLYPKKKWIAVVAIKNDKAIRGMLRELNRITAQYIFTTFQTTTDFGKSLSTPPQTLARYTHITSLKKTPVQEAIKSALSLSHFTKRPILITGSLYLVGEVRGLWSKKSY